MKFPNIGLEGIGSVKARCKIHKNKILFTGSLITTLVMLITSLMWTPAEAVFTTEGFGIYVDEQRIVSTLTTAQANAILDGVAANYAIEGATITSSGYLEDVSVRACEVVAAETKSIADGISYIMNRKTPLLTICSTQRYAVSEDIVENDANTAVDNFYDTTNKIKAEKYKGIRSYTVLLTLQNDRVIEREIIDEKLIVKAEEQKGYKAKAFTDGDALTMTVEFEEPVEMNVTSAYGDERSETGYHLGVDLYNLSGTPIMAAAEGVVTYVGYESSYGNLIIIDHRGNVETYYAHCATVNVKVGDQVSSGDYIGTVGNTGRTTGYHLHFELRLNGVTLDPMDYL